MVWENVLISVFYMSLFSFPSTIYWRDCSFSKVYFWLLCHKLTNHTCMNLFWGSLFCSTGLCNCFYTNSILVWFPDSSDDKESACNAGDPGLTPESGRSPGEGNGNPIQYFCLENSMDREAWWATVHRVTKNQTQLSS